MSTVSRPSSSQDENVSNSESPTSGSTRASGPSRGHRVGAYVSSVLVFAMFGVLLRCWFLIRGGINADISFHPVFLWSMFLGFFRDAYLAGVLASPMVLAALPRKSGWTWRLAKVVVLTALFAVFLLHLADVEFMRFYQVHISGYILSYVRELGPFADSFGALLAPWEWAIGFVLFPICYLAVSVVAANRPPRLVVDFKTWRSWVAVLLVVGTPVVGLNAYLMTRWVTREALAFQLSDNATLYLLETLRNPKYTAPPVPGDERFRVALETFRSEMGPLPLDRESRQPWHYLSDEYPLVRGTSHHACQLGLGDQLDIDCGADFDGDGFSARDDCDDTRANVYPGAPDLLNNRDDENCDGIDDARPNVILVLMESQRGVNVGAYRDSGALSESASPVLDQLGSEGLLFHNFYANGVTTARAVLATLCSIHPHVGPMLLRDYAYLNLLSLGDILRDRGYFSAYMHSGDTRFDNKRRWLDMWFDEVHDMTNTFADLPRVTSWGVSDEAMFQHGLAWADERDTPFLLTLFTVQNHHPFDVPTSFTPPYPDSDDPYERFLNTMTYQDRMLGNFIDEARTRSWFENTYIVVISDTGQVMGERGITNDLGSLPPYEESMWIPLLILGPGADRGELTTEAGDLERQVGSQVDITPTILDLLGVVTPNGFEGRSLVAPLPYDSSIALMSNPYRDVWVALRRGDTKVIHGRTSRQTRRYDLSTSRIEPDVAWDSTAPEPGDPAQTQGDPDVAFMDAWVDVQEFLIFHNQLWHERLFELP